MVAVLVAIIGRDLDRQERLAVTDPLTGLANLRAFNDRPHAESAPSKRYGHLLTLLYIDLDVFKPVSDAGGHDVGDQVLKTVAQTVANNVRQSDLVARLGGDEFAGLFPEANYESDGSLLDKICKALADAMSRQTSPITFSIGAITFASPLDNVRDMLKAADGLMYGVKKQARTTWSTNAGIDLRKSMYSRELFVTRQDGPVSQSRGLRNTSYSRASAVPGAGVQS